MFSGPLNLLFEGNLALFFAFAAAFVIAVSLHEFAHAWAADRLGDSTPRYQGRLTIDPRAHLDPIGTFLAFMVGFGWGRPVQFNPWNLKHPRRDAALISLAGPLMNFVVASVSALIYNQLPSPGNTFFLPLVFFNVVLGVFNLIPVAPLDGFKVVGGILPRDLSYKWLSLERYGMIFLLVLFLTPLGDVVGSVASPVIRFLLTNLSF